MPAFKSKNFFFTLRNDNCISKDRIENYGELEHSGTLLDKSLDEFKIMIHNSEEVPLFVGPFSRRIYISNEQSLKYAQMFEFMFQVEQVVYVSINWFFLEMK